MTPIDYAEIALKFLLGLLSMVMVINFTGKGNLAPTSAMEQIMNYVLGGIIGGVIYSSRFAPLAVCHCVVYLVFARLYVTPPEGTESLYAAYSRRQPDGGDRQWRSGCRGVQEGQNHCARIDL